MQRFRTEETTAPPTEQYDSETARQILARAVEIEQSAAQLRADTVSAAQIETLGRELGISPDAVRRALSERHTPVPATSAHTVNSLSRGFAPLTKRDIKAAFLPGLWYAPFVGLFLSWYLEANRSGGMNNAFLGVLAYILVLFAAPLIAGLYGWRIRDYRQGLLSGGLTTVLSAATVIVVFFVSLGRHGGDGSIYSYLMMSTLGGTFLGAATGAVSRWWHSLRDPDER